MKYFSICFFIDYICADNIIIYDKEVSIDKCYDDEKKYIEAISKMPSFDRISVCNVDSRDQTRTLKNYYEYYHSCLKKFIRNFKIKIYPMFQYLDFSKCEKMTNGNLKPKLLNVFKKDEYINI